MVLAYFAFGSVYNVRPLSTPVFSSVIAFSTSPLKLQDLLSWIIACIVLLRVEVYKIFTLTNIRMWHRSGKINKYLNRIMTNNLTIEYSVILQEKNGWGHFQDFLNFPLDIFRYHYQMWKLISRTFWLTIINVLENKWIRNPECPPWSLYYCYSTMSTWGVVAIWLGAV